MKSLRIAYVTTGAADDPNNWSGLVLHIQEALRAQGHQLQVIDRLEVQVPLETRLRGWIARFLQGRPYGYDRDLGLARRFALQVEARLASMQVDCVVAPRSYPVALLRTTLPVACWGDATFHALRQLYPGYDQIAPTSVRQGEVLETQAIRRCCLLGYSSHWAAQDALHHYRARPDTVHVVPFGANCPSPFGSEVAAAESVSRRAPAPLRLLFVGVDWERKGGPTALRVHQELLRRGVASELWVAGCDPFQGSPPAGVRCLGFLSKARPEDAARWRECFEQCHVFLLPTRAECFGVVFAEAAAFALPSLATKVGGVADAVIEGRSGRLFDLQAGPEAYAEVLQTWVNDWAAYQRAALEAWRASREQLNWNVAGARFSELLLEAVARHGQPEAAPRS